MVQAVLNKNFVINENNQSNLVEKIKSFISKNDCQNLYVDLSDMNVFDASKVTVLCSTYHWAKYPDGKINLKTKNCVEELVSTLNLGNII